MNSSTWYARMAKAASRFSGKPAVFVLAVGLIAGWIITGPLLSLSDTWQLVINTTIITFLMVVLAACARTSTGLGLLDTDTPEA